MLKRQGEGSALDPLGPVGPRPHFLNEKLRWWLSLSSERGWRFEGGQTDDTLTVFPLFPSRSPCWFCRAVVDNLGFLGRNYAQNDKPLACIIHSNTSTADHLDLDVVNAVMCVVSRERSSTKPKPQSFNGDHFAY